MLNRQMVELDDNKYFLVGVDGKTPPELGVNTERLLENNNIQTLKG